MSLQDRVGSEGERSPSAANVQRQPAQHAEPSPGKHTLVEHEYARGQNAGSDALPGLGTVEQIFGRREPVQAKGDASGSADAVHAAAERGTQGSATGLPHADQIQRSFGKHDVSGVQAYVGGAAQDASDAIGAQAFATGNKVAFKSAPDLHTAAHEAAHVVQQRGGVQLKGGVGEAGDAYERHADAVADRVVAGQSAEDLLEGGAGGGQALAVQRKEGPDDAKILEQQAKLKGTDVEIPALEGALLATRLEAVNRGLLSRASFDAGLRLSQAMTQLQPAVAAKGGVDKGLQDSAAASAQQLFGALQKETSDDKNFQIQPSMGESTAITSQNPYTEEIRVTTTFLVWSNTHNMGSYLEKLPGFIREGKWEEAFKTYRRLLDGLDLWVADQLRKKGKGTPEEALGNAQQHYAQLRTGLEQIADKHATRLPALFHPDPKMIEKEKAAGRPVAETVPMNVYFWKDTKDGKFHLYDLTTPSRPHEQTVGAQPTAAMMNTFFEEVARYPEGEVRYTLPGGASGVAPTTGKIKWYEWVGYAGLAVAAVGLAFLTGGASVPATVCFAAGAVAGGVSAAGHLVDTARLGTATTASVVLDVAQIVSSFASLGALSITMKAGGAAAAVSNSRWFVPLVSTAAGADVVQLVALTDITFSELTKIQNGAGSAEDKQRAMAVLLTQLIVMGGLTVLSVQGARSTRSLAGKQLEVVEQNGVPVLRVVGENTSAPVGQSETLAKGYEDAVASAGGYQRVSPAAIEALTEGLPSVKVDPADPTKAIAAWLTKELGAKEGAVVLKPLGSPGSGALVYSVTVEGKMIGVFKVFPDKGEMLRELAALQRLRNAGLKLMEAGGTSEASVIDGVPGKGGSTERGGALLEPAKGQFVQNRLIDAGKLPAGPERITAVQQIEKDVKRVAEAMAEMHDKLSTGQAVAKEFKDKEIGFLAGRWDKVKGNLPPGTDAAQIDKGLAKVQADFRSSKVDATVVHGDAHTGNFSVQDSGKVSVIDTETLFRSVNAKGEGQAPAAIDVGRYYESLFTHARLNGLTAAEAEQIQKSFLEAYRAAARNGGGEGLEAAMRFYQANWELIIIQQATGKPGNAAKEAAERLAAIVGAK